jgi:oligopeptide transport system substrate-binding protein
MTRLRLAGVVALLSTVALISHAEEAPAAKGRGAAPNVPKVLRVRTLGDPLTVDWNRAYTPVEGTLVRSLMEGLLAIEGSRGGAMKAGPGLARSWRVSPDGRVYTFELRPDVRWTDGVPLSAEQFVDSWRRLLSPSFNANYAYLLFDVENAQDFHEGRIADFGAVGVKALGPLRLQVTLRAPVVYWRWIPTFWSTFPIRQDLIDKLGADWTKPGKLVTLGPFRLESYEPRRKIVLARNPTYFGKRGNVDVVESALIEDEGAAVRLYEDGQLDFLTRIATRSVLSRTRTDFIRWPEARVVHLDFNLASPEVADVRVRRAIAMAIDRARLARLLEGASRPAKSFIPPGILGHSEDSGLSYEPRHARELLARAGVNGASLKLDLIVAGYADDVAAAQFVADALAENLGITVRLRKYEGKEFYSPLTTDGGFSMILNRWTADYPDPDNFLSIFLGGSGNNRVGWKNDGYDRGVVAARTIGGAKQRAAAYARLQHQLLEDDVVTLPLYYGRNCALVRPGIKGFTPTPTNSYLFKDFTLP